MQTTQLCLTKGEVRSPVVENVGPEIRVKETGTRLQTFEGIISQRSISFSPIQFSSSFVLEDVQGVH